MNLFKTALLAAAAVVVASTPSLAAKSTGWGGPYAGLNIGYMQEMGDLIDADGGFPLGTSGESFSPDSANNLTFGAQAGYNWQNDKLVYGLEIDARSVYGESVAGFKSGGDDLVLTETTNGAYSLRGRVGMTIDYDAMLYATGGFASLQTTAYSHSFGSDRGAPSQIFTGWTAGVGAEKKLNSTYSAKLEASWSEFTQKKWSDANSDQWGYDPSNFQVSTGINYHF